MTADSARYALVGPNDQLRCSLCDDPLEPGEGVGGIERVVIAAHSHHARQHPFLRAWLLIESGTDELLTNVPDL